MSDDDYLGYHRQFWSERRSSIRVGNSSIDSMQRLSSMNSMKQSTDLYETRETASSLPTLEELSNEGYYYIRSPTEILMGKIEVSHSSLLKCLRQLDAVQTAYHRISVELGELGQMAAGLRRWCGK